mgnify:CR=1 FL=1
MGTFNRGLLACAGLLAALLEATALICSVRLVLLVFLVVLGVSGSEGAEAVLDAGGGVVVLSRGRTTCAPELSLGSVRWVVLCGAVLLDAIGASEVAVADGLSGEMVGVPSFATGALCTAATTVMGSLVWFGWS